MSRGPATFRKRDAEALIKAALAAGVKIEAVRVSKDGTITIVTSRDLVEPVEAPANKSEWDDL